MPRNAAEPPAPPTADEQRALDRMAVVIRGSMNIPANVATCRRCGGMLRVVNPSRNVFLVVCDHCEAAAPATADVVQYIADQIG